MTEIPVIKIFVAGPGSVGKTTMVERYVTGIFNPKMILTIGVNHAVKTVKTSDGRECTLQIWDLGGEERFRFFLEGYIKGSTAGMAAFDLSSFSTYEALRDWLVLIRKMLPDIPLLLIGMKADLKKAQKNVSLYQSYMKEFHLEELIFTSSKTGENIEHIFQKLADYLPKEPLYFRTV